MSSDGPEPVLIAAPGGAAVWRIDLDASQDHDAALALLSADERGRAMRFVFDVHRRRFVIGRAWLRTLLGQRIGVAPSAVAFRYGPAGKPALAGVPGPRFNLSHSDRYALVAIAEASEVGIDIERIRPLADLEALAERVFSPGEREALAGVPAARRAPAFFAGWTRKEAYIKARGDGIGLLGSIEVTLAPDESPRLVGVAAHPLESERWSLWALAPVEGFAAALCLERAGRP